MQFFLKNHRNLYRKNWFSSDFIPWAQSTFSLLGKISINLRIKLCVSLSIKSHTRRFSNHESRLLSRSHTFAITVILDLKIHQSMWIHWPFFSKNLNQRSLIPRWPLTPCLLRSHVWLYPRIIVSKSHDNTSMYVDTVINFAKYHIHTTYYVLRTTYRMSDHIVSYWTQFRRDKNHLNNNFILKENKYRYYCPKWKNTLKLKKIKI